MVSKIWENPEKAPRNSEQMIAAAVEAFRQLPQAVLQNAIKSVVVRSHACVAVQGGHFEPTFVSFSKKFRLILGSKPTASTSTEKDIEIIISDDEDHELADFEIDDFGIAQQQQQNEQEVSSEKESSGLDSDFE